MRKLLFTLFAAMMTVLTFSIKAETTTVYVVGAGDGLGWDLPGKAYTGEDGVVSFTVNNLTKFKASTINATEWDGDNGYNAGSYGPGENTFGDSVYPNGQELPMVSWGEDIDLPWTGNYTITMDFNNNKIKAQTNTPKPTTAPAVYIRGGMNGWGSPAAWQFTNESWTGTAGKWTFTGTIPAGQEFKIADASWGAINYTLNNTNLTPVLDSPYNAAYNGGNTKLAAAFTGTVILEITNYTGHVAKITFTEDSGGTVTPSYPEKLYIIGTINGDGWDPSNVAPMTDDGEGVYTIESVTLGENGGSCGFAITVGGSTWNDVNSLRFGPAVNDRKAVVGSNTVDGIGDLSWTIDPGTYKMVFNYDDKTLQITSIGSTEPETPTYPDNMYIIGTIDGNGWNPSNVKLMLNEGDGIYSIENVTLNTFDGSCGFAFTAGGSDWTEVNKLRWGPAVNDTQIEAGEELEDIAKNENSYGIAPGIYNFTICINPEEPLIYAEKVGDIEEGGDNPGGEDEPSVEAGPFDVTYDFGSYDNLKEYYPALPAESDWTVDGSNIKYTLPQDVVLSADNTSLIGGGTGSAPVFYKSNTGYTFRVYTNSTLTIQAPKGGYLSKIVINSSSTASNVKKFVLTGDKPGYVDYESVSKQLTWTPSEPGIAAMAADGVSEVTFVYEGSASIFLTSIEVEGEVPESGEPEVPEEAGPGWYVYGTMNGWKASTDWQLAPAEEGSNLYTLSGVEIPFGAEFKIVNKTEDSETVYSLNSTPYVINPGTSYTLYTVTGDDNNMWMSVTLQNAEVSFNISTKSFKVTGDQVPTQWAINGQTVNGTMTNDGTKAYYYVVMTTPGNFQVERTIGENTVKFGPASGNLTTVVLDQAYELAENSAVLDISADIVNPNGPSRNIAFVLDMQAMTITVKELPDELYMAQGTGMFNLIPQPAEGDVVLTWNSETGAYEGTAEITNPGKTGQYPVFIFYTDAEHKWTPGINDATTQGEIKPNAFGAVEFGNTNDFNGYTVTDAVGRWYIAVWPQASPNGISMEMSVNIVSQRVLFTAKPPVEAPEAIYLWATDKGLDYTQTNWGQLEKGENDVFSITLDVPEVGSWTYDNEGVDVDGEGYVFHLATNGESVSGRGTWYLAPKSAGNEGDAQDNANVIDLSMENTTYSVIADTKRTGRDFVILNGGTYKLSLQWNPQNPVFTAEYIAPLPERPSELRVATYPGGWNTFKNPYTPSPDDPVLTYDATTDTYVGSFEWTQFTSTAYNYKRFYSVNEEGVVTYYGTVAGEYGAGATALNFTSTTDNPADPNPIASSEDAAGVGAWYLQKADADGTHTMAEVQATVSLTDNTVSFEMLKAWMPKPEVLYLKADEKGNGSYTSIEMHPSDVDANVYEAEFNVPAITKLVDPEGGDDVGGLAEGNVVNLGMRFYISINKSSGSSGNYGPVTDDEQIEFVYGGSKTVEETWEARRSSAIAMTPGNTKFSFNWETLEFVMEYLDELTYVPTEDGYFFDSPIDMEFVTTVTNPVEVEVPVSIVLEDQEASIDYAGYQFTIVVPEWIDVTDAVSNVENVTVTLGQRLAGNQYRIMGVVNPEGATQTLIDEIVTLKLATNGDIAWDASDYTQFTVGESTVTADTYPVIITEPSVWSTVTGDDMKLKGYDGVINVIIKDYRPVEDAKVVSVELLEPSYSESKEVDDITVGESLAITVETDPEDTTDEFEWTSDVDGVTVVWDETQGKYIVNTDDAQVADGESVDVVLSWTCGDKSGTVEFTLRGIILGDSNDNQIVTVADVVTTANHIAELPVTRFDFPNANVILREEDGEQVINTDDVVATIDIALGQFDGKRELRRKSRGILSTDALITDNFTVRNANPMTLGVNLDNMYTYVALQTVVEIPQGMKVLDVTAGPRLADHRIVSNIDEAGNVHVVIYSTTNAAIKNVPGALFNLVVTADAECGDITMRNVHATDANYNGYELSFDGGLNESIATGIDGIDADNADVRYFTVDGLEVVNPEAGMILIRVEGNNVEKVVIK